jgi:Na+-driven multidrug efflux pump
MNLVCFWLAQIPLAYWLAKVVAMGPNGVFIAMVTAEILLTILGIVVFRRGTWKLRVA